MSAENIVFLIFCLIFVIPTIYVLRPSQKNSELKSENHKETET